MCGIVGITEKNEEAVRKAALCTAHRGPDAFGIYADEQVTLGHNRLSIIDLDPRSNQPFWDEDGKVGLIYNGEIYNYKEIKDELTQLGHTFHTQSDTEVVLCAYKEWGKDLGSRLNGMFAFAIYDKEREEITLATDHANIKPLVYAPVDGVLVFGSEIRNIAKILKEKNISLEIDQEALELYLALGYVSAPRTLYKQIKRLPKRAWVTYNLKNKSITEEQYPERIAKSVSEKELYKLIEERVLSHLVADVPVGVFFSGGTDSSLLVSILHKHDISLETFSVGLGGRPEDEEYFREISERLGIKAHTYTFDTPEFEGIYKEVAEKVDEPLYDSSLFPTYFISKKATGRVKVVLSGEGGDEYFFGYPRSVALIPLLNTKLDSGTGIAEKLYFLLPHFKGKNKLFEKLFLLLRRPLAYYLLTVSPGKSMLTFEGWRRAKQEVARLAESVRALDANLYLPGDLLRKLDTATMYCSLEGRVPLLDPDIIAAAKAAAPPPKDTPKALLKYILSVYLPKELVYRKKQGFGLSLPRLFASSALLAEDLEQALSYLRVRNLLPKHMPPQEVLVARNPRLAFGLVMLYHALYNVEQI